MDNFESQPDISPQPAPNAGPTPPGVYDHPTDPNLSIIQAADGSKSVIPKTAMAANAASSPSVAPMQLAPIGLPSTNANPSSVPETPPNAPVPPPDNSADKTPTMPIESKHEEQIQTEQKRYDPKDLKKRDAAVNAFLDATKAKYDAEAAAAANEREMHLFSAGELQKQQKDIQDRVKEEQTQLNKYRKDYDDITAEYNNMSVDPNRYFGNASTGDKIMAGIAIALGGLGAPAFGGRNVALEIIQKSIDRDIDAQKANISAKGRAVEMKRGAYADYLASLGDARAADLAEQNRQLKKADELLNAQMSADKAGILKANGAATSAAFKEQIAQNDADLHTIMTKKAQQDVVDIGGKKAAAHPLSGDQAKELANEAESIAVKERLLNKFDSMQKEYGPVMGRLKQGLLKININPGTDFATLDQQSKLAAIQAAKQMFPGRLSDQEVNMALSLMPTVADNPSVATARLKEMIKNDKEALRRRSNIYDTIRAGGSISVPTSASDIEQKYSK